MRVPIVAEMRVPIIAIARSIRGAKITRLKISIPVESVPKRWDRLGGWR